MTLQMQNESWASCLRDLCLKESERLRKVVEHQS